MPLTFLHRYRTWVFLLEAALLIVAIFACEPTSKETDKPISEVPADSLRDTTQAGSSKKMDSLSDGLGIDTVPTSLRGIVGEFPAKELPLTIDPLEYEGYGMEKDHKWLDIHVVHDYIDPTLPEDTPYEVGPHYFPIARYQVDSTYYALIYLQQKPTAPDLSTFYVMTLDDKGQKIDVQRIAFDHSSNRSGGTWHQMAKIESRRQIATVEKTASTESLSQETLQQKERYEDGAYHFESLYRINKEGEIIAEKEESSKRRLESL